MRGLEAVSIADLEAYDVNVDGQPLVTWQPQWDYQDYPNAGFTGERLFFQIPIGQASKTLEDTSMSGQGRLPTPVNMMVTGIEAVFFSGASPVELAGGVAVTSSIWNDLYAVHNGRLSVKFKIGDKTWLEEAPIGVMPSCFWLDGPAAIHYTQAAAADELAKIDYASFRGPPYQVVPFRLISNQQFSLTVNSPAAIALPSGVDGRWGFRLHGYKFALAQ